MKKFLPYLVLLAGVAQVLVPYVLITQGFFNEKTPLILYIQPAGYVFAIWGLIYLFASLYAVYQVIPRFNNKVLAQNRIYALILFVGSSVWLWASNLPLEWLWVTVPILIVMAYVGYRAVRVPAITHAPNHMWVQFISWQCLIIYAAWTNIAQFVNIGAMMTQYNVFTPGTVWIIANVVSLVVISVWLWVQFKSLNHSLWYGAVVVWALIGVFVANDGEVGNKVVMYLAAVLTIPFILAMASKAVEEIKKYKVVKE